ncbi:MAG: AraC family transcriptional regulator [Gemmatimonadota bacterium]|nr:helix-turn-helix transcriptional regulator [Gemmatimonadota bacterium]
MIEYREIPPPAPLRDAVVCFWSLRGQGAGAGSPWRILPDGCFDLLLPLAGDVERGAAGERIVEPRVIGPMTRSLEVRSPGSIELVGIRFRPGPASRLFPLRALRDLAVPAADLVAGTGALADRVRASPERERPARLAEWLTCALARAPIEPADAALARTLSAVGPGRVRDLARSLGLSERQLHRRTLALWGLSPAETRSLGRFRRALVRLHGGRTTLSEVAHACGYADHAHMTREFVRFSGQPPSRHRAGHAGAPASDPFKTGRR